MDYEFPKDTRFACEKCARCCGDTEDIVRQVLLLKTEAERISNIVSKEILEFAKEVSGFEPYVYEIKKTEDKGKCHFLETNRCTIYDVRPIICRFYPFELINLGNDDYLFSYTNNCPGIGEGLPLDHDFFEKLFRTALDAMNEDSKSE